MVADLESLGNDLGAYLEDNVELLTTVEVLGGVGVISDSVVGTAAGAPRPAPVVAVPVLRA